MRKSAAEERLDDLALQRVRLILQADESVEQILERGTKMRGKEMRIREEERGKRDESWMERRKKKIN